MPPTSMRPIPTSASQRTGRQRREGSRPSGNSSRERPSSPKLGARPSCWTQAAVLPPGNGSDAMKSIWSAYWLPKLARPKRRPVRQKIQPIGFSGARAATMAPTVAKATEEAANDGRPAFEGAPVGRGVLAGCQCEQDQRANREHQGDGPVESGQSAGRHEPAAIVFGRDVRRQLAGHGGVHRWTLFEGRPETVTAAAPALGAVCGSAAGLDPLGLPGVLRIAIGVDLGGAPVMVIGVLSQLLGTHGLLARRGLLAARPRSPFLGLGASVVGTRTAQLTLTPHLAGSARRVSKRLAAAPGGHGHQREHHKCGNNDGDYRFQRPCPSSFGSCLRGRVPRVAVGNRLDRRAGALGVVPRSVGQS